MIKCFTFITFNLIIDNGNYVTIERLKEGLLHSTNINCAIVREKKKNIFLWQKKRESWPTQNVLSASLYNIIH